MKSLFLHTFGCQMNESDSQRMRESLAVDSWQAVETPEQADLILLNTCAIREKAEQKLRNQLGDAGWKNMKEMVFAMTEAAAQA